MGWKDTFNKAMGKAPAVEEPPHPEQPQAVNLNQNAIGALGKPRVMGRFIVVQQFQIKRDGATLLLNDEKSDAPILGIYWPGQSYALTTLNHPMILLAQERGLCVITAALPQEGLRLT